MTFFSVIIHPVLLLISFIEVMHQNRIDYSYRQYQDLILDRWASTLFWFAKKEDKGYDLYFAKPTPRLPWLAGKPRTKYYRRLFARLYSQLKSGSFHYSFCTLTYHTRKYSQKYSFLMLKAHLKEFIRRLRKRYPNIQYFWVIELTKRLYPHIHIVFNQFVHWKVIRAIWYHVTKSYITDIRSIPAGNISAYMSKYLNSQKKQNESQWGTIFKNVDRLYGCSGSFFTKKPVDTSPQEWFLISISTNIMIEDWRLAREDSDKDFWLIPHHYAAGLLLYHAIDHTNWLDSYPDIYQSFTGEYNRRELMELNDNFHYYSDGFNPDNVIPF